MLSSHKLNRLSGRKKDDNDSILDSVSNEDSIKRTDRFRMR